MKFDKKKKKTDKKKDSKQKMRVVKAPKAYDNHKFLHSRDGRELRLLAEYLQPRRYFRKYKIKNSIIFFGSARSLPSAEYEKKLAELKTKLDNAAPEDKQKCLTDYDRMKFQKDISKAYDDAVKLSEMLSEWSKTLPKKKRFIICTGGGPGMMEAANRGAFNVDAPSIGLNISLPFEQFPNQFISPDLNFEFHYFFMRKFWFVNLAQAMVVFPGGFGTLDELMEILTLRQTHKTTKPMPILLYSEDYWKNVINFNFLAEKGMISFEDLNLFKFVSSPKEAFEILKTELTKIHDLPATD